MFKGVFPMVQSSQRSFRITPPPYMLGKRVKTRLRVLMFSSWLFTLVIALLSAAGVSLLVEGPMGAPIRNSALICGILFFGIPYVIAHLILRALRMMYTRFGLMTQEEALDFPFRGRWPDSWLETAAQDNQFQQRADNEGNKGEGNKGEQRGRESLKGNKGVGSH